MNIQYDALEKTDEFESLNEQRISALDYMLEQVHWGEIPAQTYNYFAEEYNHDLLAFGGMWIYSRPLVKEE